MAKNQLKWPQFEQLGRDFYDELVPTLDQITAGAHQLDDEALRGLARLQSWLEAPCVATVKMDGTNVGVDNAGLIVGRNTIVEPGETYQKTDVWSLLAGYPDKAERLRDELACAVGQEAVAQAMLYGELLVNSKYNYTDAGVFKQWLCFGAVLRPVAEDDEATSRLAIALRGSGYNARQTDGKVCVTPNAQLAALLKKIDVRTVAEAYRPAGSITEDQWAEHNSAGNLPCFGSLRQLILSEWAQHFLLPTNGVPLGEGLVVASEADGKLFKWKHGGEELGKVPEQLAKAVTVLQGLAGSPLVELLPSGLLDVLERLLLVATTKPRIAASVPKPKEEKGKQEDTEALAVWESALTKFDALETAFERGPEAQKHMQTELIAQIAQDLVKDYGASEKDAQQRATKVARTEMGKRFGIWKKSLNSGA